MKKHIFFAVVLAGAVCSAAELFNGKNLDGWVSVADHSATGGYSTSEPTWGVVDGAIRTTGTPFGYLRTKRSDFANYRLKFEYRWWRGTEKPNSGVFVRLSADTGTFIPRAYENQLERESVCSVFALGGAQLEGVSPRTQYDPADALSGIAAVPRKATSSEKGMGEWNLFEVEVNGDSVINRLNGVELNRVKGLKTMKGAIGLQSEGGAIEFRNIVLEELS